MDDHPMNDEGCALSAKGQLVEVGVFLFLVFPSLLLPYFGARQLGAGFTVTAAGTILHNLAFLSLIAFFAWRNGESWERFGWVGSRVGREAILGAGLFLLMSFAVILIQQAFSAAGVSLPSHPLPPSLIPHSRAGYVLAFVLVVVVAVSEETIFRGYMILRFTAAFRSRPAAVLLSTLIFSLGHGYEGIVGVVAVFFIGLFLSGVYMWRKSLVAPMVIHFLQDFLGLFTA